MGEQVPKNVVFKELGLGFWDGLGRYYNFFPFKIMVNTFPASDFSLSEPYSLKELESDNNG